MIFAVNDRPTGSLTMDKFRILYTISFVGNWFYNVGGSIDRRHVYVGGTGIARSE